MKRFLFLLLPLFFCVGCEKQISTTGVARINLGADPHSLDPRVAHDTNSNAVMRMLYEGLTRIGRDDQPELALAKGVRISEDLKSYTFTLREAQWTNGDLVEASDFIDAWQTVLSPSFLSDNAYQLYVLKNGKAVKEGALPIEELGVRALDEKTLLVELEYPIPYLLELLAMPCFSPIHGKETNGPFFLEEYRYADHLLVKKNPLYWDADTVQLEGIDLIMIEGDTELKLFEKGELHWAGSPLSTLPVDALETLKQTYSVHVKPSAETAFLRTNLEVPALQCPKLRRALALAIDRKSITEHVMRGGQLPAMGLLPPSMQHAKASYFEDNQREEAIHLYHEALEEMEVPKLSLIYIHTERTHLIAQSLQQQWREAFGILIHLEALERKIFFDRVSHGDYELAYCSWSADFHDPINFLELFKYKTQCTNYTGWESPEYSKALTSSFFHINPNERFALLQGAEEVLMDAMPIIPLCHYSMLYMHDEKLQGVFLSALGNLDFKWASLDNDN